MLTAAMPPNYSPWGKVDHASPHGPFWQVSTASHGGIKVPPELNRVIPDGIRNAEGWYEEDCHWCVVVAHFPEHFEEGMRNDALPTMRAWYPDAYERFTGTSLRTGESHTRDQAVFNRENASRMVVSAAFGDWHDKVPSGMVGVLAKRGFTMNDECSWYLISADDYAKRTPFGFVVDESRYHPIPALQ